MRESTESGSSPVRDRRSRLFKFLSGSRQWKACCFFVLCVKGAPYSHQDTSGLPEELDPHAGTQLPRKPLDLPSSSDLAATGTESRMTGSGNWNGGTRARGSSIPSPSPGYFLRRSYAVYIIHPVVLVRISLLLRGWDAPALVKLVVTGSLGCATS